MQFSILDMGDGDHDDLFHLLGMWHHHLTSNIWTNQSTMKLVVFGTGLLKLFLQSPHGMVKVMLRGASKIGQDILP